MTSVDEIAQVMKTLLTTTAERVGRDTHFVRRRSKLTPPAFAQTVVFGWQQSPAAALSELAQMARTVGVAITPQGLEQRFHAEAATFLHALLAAAMTTVVSADPVAIPLLQRFRAVLIRDSTIISLPDALAKVWRGCGDVTRHHLAALKVQVHCDLLTGTLGDLLLADGRTHDRICAGMLPPVPTGALCLADLGYFRLAFLQELSDHGAYFVSRLFVQTALFAPGGERLDLAAVLRTAATWPADLAIELGADERLAVQLIAVPVAQEIADQRRRQIKEAARKHGQKVSQAQLALADWTILLTNAPADLLSVAEILVLGRVRWQVELLFKLWKQHGQLDAWRSGQPWRILCEVYAKLLGLLLQHWVLIASCWAFPDRSLVKAATTLRAQIPLLAYAVAGHFDLVQVLTLIQTTLQGAPKQERRRAHPAAYQLLLEPSLALQT
jgi:hypothetical protein